MRWPRPVRRGQTEPKLLTLEKATLWGPVLVGLSSEACEAVDDEGCWGSDGGGGASGEVRLHSTPCLAQWLQGRCSSHCTHR